MKKIAIFTGKEESPVFQGFGLRCSNCQEVVEAIKYIVIPEDYCCDSIKNNMHLDYDEGIIPEYDIKTNSFAWIATVDEAYAFTDMKYCPFCGKALPLYPASIPD